MRVITLSILLLAVYTTFAQPGNGPGGRGGKRHASPEVEAKMETVDLETVDLETVDLAVTTEMPTAQTKSRARKLQNWRKLMLTSRNWRFWKTRNSIKAKKRRIFVANPNL